MGDRGDVARPDHPPRAGGRGVQRPRAPGGVEQTRRGDGRGLPLAVALGGMDPLAAAVRAQRRRRALPDEAPADARGTRSRGPPPDRRGEAPITPRRPARAASAASSGIRARLSSRTSALPRARNPLSPARSAADGVTR